MNPFSVMTWIIFTFLLLPKRRSPAPKLLGVNPKVKRRLPYFLGEVYNRNRLHSAIGYRLTDECEELLLDMDNNVFSKQNLLTLFVQS